MVEAWHGRTDARTSWVVAGVAVLLIVVGAGAASRAAGASSEQADRVRATERARLHAMVAADTATARRLMADDFQGINPGGVPSSREGLLSAVDSGQLDFLASEPTSPIEVRMHGDAAVIRYQIHFDLFFGGLRLTHEGWITGLYERREGDWKLVWEQATAVPNDFGLLVQALMPKS
jgi:hypothetical protein